MFETLVYKDIVPGKTKKQFDETLKQLASGNFVAAEVKKMVDTGFYRAKLDYENRLLFKFARYRRVTYLLILEIIFNHEYEKSRFLRGVKIDESKLQPLKSHSEIKDSEIQQLIFLNEKQKKFHVLDKVLSFDQDQEELLSLPLPHIIIGSAGSGKTALTLEKIKTLSNKILYITLSPYLAENSARLFYSNNYENENLEVDFLSFREFIETLRIPEGIEMDFKTFESWFTRYRQASGLKDAHKTFEEFRGVITGLDITKEFLPRNEYLSLGVKQSIYAVAEREMVYNLFEKYLSYLKEQKYYDINILSHRWLPLCKAEYDYIIIDEVQDFTNIQLHIILKSLLKPLNFILCGDSNQVVHPNFFSWSHLKTMFYDGYIKGNGISILHTNYRNSQTISDLANKLLKVKIARFGSIDKESNYLVKTVSENAGNILFIDSKGNTLSELDRKTRMSANTAIIVMRNEDKAKAKSVFQTPLIFSVQESKGLEYENVILHNFITDNADEFNNICEGVMDHDLQVEEFTYSRAKDKTDKSHEVYKFYINSLYVAVTRGVSNIYIVEQAKGHKLIRLLGISEAADNRVIKEEVSSVEDWKREAQRLEKQGKKEQAEAIRKNILHFEKIPWEPITYEIFMALKNEALDSENFNKKAKDRLFDFLIAYEQPNLMEQLAFLKYKRAEKYEVERGSIFRKYYQYYKEDNPKMVAGSINKYGIDYRDLFNFTPLHAAVFSGSVNCLKMLLDNGANANLTDTFGRNAIQIALAQASRFQEYAQNKLGKIYPQILSTALKIKVDDHLIKIDSHKIEFLLLNLLIAVQSSIIQKKDFFSARGVQVDDIINNIKYFSETVWPEFRKQRNYIQSLLSKHEVNSSNKYNKKLFIRINRGYYKLNPSLYIEVNDQWILLNDFFQNQGVSEEEDHDFKLKKAKIVMEEDNRKREEEMRKFEKRQWH